MLLAASCAVFVTHARADACTPSFTQTGPRDFVVIDGNCVRHETHLHEDGLSGATTSPGGSVDFDGSFGSSMENGVMRYDVRDEKTQKMNYFQVGGDWPVAGTPLEYISRIPRPDAPFMSVNVNSRSESLAVILKKDESGVKDMKAYVEKLKAFGYVIDAATKENPKLGFFSYRAKNSAGFLIHAACGAGHPCHFSLYNPRGAQKEAERLANQRKRRECTDRQSTQELLDALK
jgi:hypothetical protein